MAWNPQTQHLQGTQKHMADSHYNNVKKQNEQKYESKESIKKKVESTKTEDTYESIMNQIIEESGLTLDEFMKQNNEIYREALYNNIGLSEEDVAYIETRLAKKSSK